MREKPKTVRSQQFRILSRTRVNNFRNWTLAYWVPELELSELELSVLELPKPELPEPELLELLELLELSEVVSYMLSPCHLVWSFE